MKRDALEWSQNFVNCTIVLMCCKCAEVNILKYRYLRIKVQKHTLFPLFRRKKIKIIQKASRKLMFFAFK